MKVGTITLLTAFLLVLPLTSFAGGDPCAGLGGDTDGDTICDNVDNCVDTPNGPGDLNNQGDVDLDGQGDVCDNCLLEPNGPSAGPYPGINGVNDGIVVGPGLEGSPTPGLQCDTNADGYGNACDADLNNDGLTSGVTDQAQIFNPVLTIGGPPAFVWIGNAVGGTLADVGLVSPLVSPGPQNNNAQEVDHNCDNLKTGVVDQAQFFNPQLTLPGSPAMNRGGAPGVGSGGGRSGLSCVAAPFAPTPPGTCAPHN